MILILSNSPKGIRLKNQLENIGQMTELKAEILTIEDVFYLEPDLVISHGYSKIVKKDVIDYLGKRIINVHPSILPYNRGSYSNFWSFIYDTDKGITIHQMDEGIDTGDILLQKKIDFDEKKETFQTTYNIIEDLALKMLVDNISDLKNNSISAKKQNGNGTYHSIEKFEKLKKIIPIDWNENISVFKKKNYKIIQNYLNEIK